MPVHHVDRALEALAHRERVRGLGEVGVVDDNGVEIVAGDKAAVPAEVLMPRAGAEVVALFDGQKFVLPVDTLIPFYLIFFMVFSPKYSEKQLNCTTYFDLPDFLAPFWHRRILKPILFCRY